MRAIAYVRVSTREQDEEVQRKAIEEFSETRNIEVSFWYVDKGESGAKPFKDRPGASRLLGDVKRQRTDLVIAWSLDRFGRTMVDTLNTVMGLEAREGQGRHGQGGVAPDAGRQRRQARPERPSLGRGVREEKD